MNMLIFSPGCDVLVNPVGGKHGKTIGRRGGVWKIMVRSKIIEQEIPLISQQRPNIGNASYLLY